MSEDRIPTMPQLDEERIPTMPQSDGERIPTMPQFTEERVPTMPQMDNSRIPTMPQMDNDRIPTMPQGMQANEGRIPTMPQMGNSSSERIPTMPQGAGSGNGHIPTMPQSVTGADGRVATMPQQGGVTPGIVGGRLLLSSDINFTGDRGNSFIIEASNVISADSGESQIYGCHRLVGDEKLVARVLISITPESEIEKRQTRDKVIRFLDGMSENEDSHILPLFDHGTITVNGKDYYVEIYPFCEGGDLGRRKGQIPYKELHDDVIPALNQALHFFHSAGLVHRDVKPDNLYKYNGKVVIGDFGITCDLREDGFATDKYKTGTLGYYAPELMSQAAIKASDYYSFGQTIWTLYSGEMMYRNILRRYKEYGLDEQRNQVNFAMLSNTYYGLDEISKDDSFFEILIRGLLQYDPSHRFDYDKVKRWISGDKSVAHDISDFDASKTFTRSFRLFDVECWDDEDVCRELSTHWEDALSVLYDGGLKDFYASQTYEHARFLDGIMKNYTRCDNSDAIPFRNNIGLAKTIMYFSKNKMLCWRGDVYKSLNDISIALEEYLDNNHEDNDYYGLVYSELIGEWYSTFANAQNDMLDALNSLTDMLKLDDYGAGIALNWLRFLLAEDRSKLQISECEDLPKYVRYLLEEPGRIYGGRDDAPIVDNTKFLGLLCAWGYDETVQLFHDALDKGYADRYELLFDFIEREMESDDDKKLVDNFYCNYGPKGYLTWWKNNSGEYTYNGKSSRAIKDSIDAVSIEPNSSIAEQREVLATLSTLSNQFVQRMESDLFMASIGIQGLTGDYIFSEKLSCSWDYEFLGQQAPVGFKFYLGI